MKISLVIPVKNEEASIQRLLESIYRQKRLPDEVIFVDAGSSDRTKDVIKEHNDGRIRIDVVSAGKAYPGTARNRGVSKAQFEIIAFTDGGIVLSDEWLSQLSSAIAQDGSIDAVFGNYAPTTDTFFRQCLSMAFVPPPRMIKRRSMRSHFIASSLLKKHVWREVGGFPDYRAAEDRIFMEAVEKRGFKIDHRPDAHLTWDIPENSRQTFRKFFHHAYHGCNAGRTRDWHVPVLKMYLAGAVSIIAGCIISPFFFLLPAFGFSLRAIKKILINRKEPFFKVKNIPGFFLMTAFLVFLIDMALFSGWIAFYVKRDAYHA